MQPTTISLRQASPVTCVFDIQGDVAMTAEQTLLAAYTQATVAGARLIVLNFAQMAYMNSGGISLLITLLVQARARQQRLFAVGLSDFYRSLFQITKLDEVICVYEREDEALLAAGA